MNSSRSRRRHKVKKLRSRKREEEENHLSSNSNSNHQTQQQHRDDKLRQHKHEKRRKLSIMKDKDNVAFPFYEDEDETNKKRQYYFGISSFVLVSFLGITIVYVLLILFPSQWMTRWTMQGENITTWWMNRLLNHRVRLYSFLGRAWDLVPHSINDSKSMSMSMQGTTFLENCNNLIHGLWMQTNEMYYEGCLFVMGFLRIVYEIQFLFRTYVLGCCMTWMTTTISMPSSSLSVSLSHPYMLVLLLVILLLFIFYMKQTSKNNQHQNDSYSENMEILRATRDRASTFDFFGTNHQRRLRQQQEQRNHRRSHSESDLYSDTEEDNNTFARSRSDSLSNVNVGDYFKSRRRERMGSMDLFYASSSNSNRGGGGEQQQQHQRHAHNLSSSSNHSTSSSARRRQQQHQQRQRHNDTNRPNKHQKMSLLSSKSIATPSQGLGWFGKGGFFSQIKSTFAINASTPITVTTNNDNSNHMDNPKATATNKDEEGYLYDEFGLVTLSYKIKYYGPTMKHLFYNTWTPPTPWSEVSKHIVPQDIMLKLRRRLELDFQSDTLTFAEVSSSSNHHPSNTPVNTSSTNSGTSHGRSDLSLPATNFSIHVCPPCEGAVLNLYIKGTPKDEWMEHTFASAQQAAQFQLDLIAYQVFGNILMDVFQAMTLVYLGSDAFEKSEYVLHHVPKDRQNWNSLANEDDEEEERPNPVAAIAWDDAMRAFSSIPTIRIGLERLWLHHRSEKKFTQPPPAATTTKANTSLPDVSVVKEGDDVLLTEMYLGKRLMLGPIDFFRLFVPALPESAIPQAESTIPRMEQLLSWRKRVARAAVLARTYVTCRQVVNIGWTLDSKKNEDDETQPEFLRHRLAFDDNEDNYVHDSNTRNEVYEASVSRDIQCHVRPFDYFSRKAKNTFRSSVDYAKIPLVLSPYQGFALVGVQVFQKYEVPNEVFPLRASRDPVEAIPSLRHIIERNPNVDFLVTSYHRADTISILLYARSLAKEVDPQFDMVIRRFAQGTKEARDKKVHMMIQMGDSQTLSLWGLLVLRILSFLFSLTRKGRESPLGIQGRRDRIPFPAIRLASYGDIFHFGGALQENDALPSNYVSMNIMIASTVMPNLITRLLFSRLENQISERVLDFTLVLEGEYDDELPERALCTSRFVKVDTISVAQDPAECDLFPEESIETPTVNSSKKFESSEIVPRRLADEFKSPSTDQSQARQLEDANDVISESFQLSPEVLDAVLDEIVLLVEDIEVPTKIANRVASPGSLVDLQSSSALPEDMTMVPVLKLLNREEMKNFAIVNNADIKKTVVHIINTLAWKGRIFPVDTRMCRIELQNSQLFEQGIDRQGNLIFWFKCVARGPWRRDYNATLAAALHEFNSRISRMSALDSETKVTLVVLLGSSGIKSTASTFEDSSDNASAGTGLSRNGSTEDDVTESGTGSEAFMSVRGEACRTNSRISHNESLKLHATNDLVENLVSLLFRHYPGKIAKVIFVKGKSPRIYRTKVAAARAMQRIVVSAAERNKLRYVQQVPKLKLFIDEMQLAEVAGDIP